MHFFPTFLSESQKTILSYNALYGQADSAEMIVQFTKIVVEMDSALPDSD